LGKTLLILYCLIFATKSIWFWDGTNKLTIVYPNACSSRVSLHNMARHSWIDRIDSSIDSSGMGRWDQSWMIVNQARIGFPWQIQHDSAAVVLCKP
jgi:hypothetical protein